jgi:hypothetical protein
MMPTRASSDLELMEFADGETTDPRVAARADREPDARAKIAAVRELGELVRGHVELAADAVPDARFAAMWRRIDDQLDAPRGPRARFSAWLDRYRGHVLTGVASAGVVAALAIVLRPSLHGSAASAVDVLPVALRAAPEIDGLDTPGGSTTVFDLADEDGHTAVIWVSPADTVEGI